MFSLTCSVLLFSLLFLLSLFCHSLSLSYCLTLSCFTLCCFSLLSVAFSPSSLNLCFTLQWAFTIALISSWTVHHFRIPKLPRYFPAPFHQISAHTSRLSVNMSRRCGSCQLVRTKSVPSSHAFCGKTARGLHRS